MKKDTEQFLRGLRHEGWCVERTKSSHWKLVPPGGGHIVFASSTPSDHSSLKKLKADCRRAVSTQRLCKSYQKDISDEPC
jgi:predicted RNA binding protein YcfA (HicA-like mRNA interferase family)